ncbi:MAG: zinc-binding dehydrogenase [Anaerolineae bacterium]|nr:zinc-binding dehydrogenase [Anaerolineae bacterium]
MLPTTMKALNFADFNRLELEDVPVPGLQQPDDVLVRVRAAGVCGSDLHGYTGKSGRRHPPLIMGHEVSGEVIATGEAAADVQTGARVAIQPLIYRPDPATGKIVRRLIGMNLPGAFAEYVVVPRDNLYAMPEDLSYLAGALTEPTAVAVHAVSMAHIQPYDRVLVIGGGTIGLLTMQVLNIAGARQVVVSDVSEDRLRMAEQMGATATINPQSHDFNDFVASFTDGRGFDHTFEAVGLTSTVAQSLTAIRDGGTVIWIGNNQKIIEVDMQAIVTRELRVFGTYGMNERDFQRALQMLADGHIAADILVNRRAALEEGPSLFDELLRDPSVVKCVIEIDA